MGTQGYTHDGMRWSTAHGYLRPAMERSNLDIAIKSQVNKVIHSVWELLAY